MECSLIRVVQVSVFLFVLYYYRHFFHSGGGRVVSPLLFPSSREALANKYIGVRAKEIFIMVDCFITLHMQTACTVSYL